MGDRVQFPHGAVTADAPAWQAREERINAWQPVLNLASLVGALLILIGGLIGVYLLWFTRGRDKPAGDVAEFITQPPDELAPGMAGALLKEGVDMKDILATLIDLARRGYLRIVEGEDRQRVQLRAAAQIRPFACARLTNQLLDKLFGKRAERDLSSLKNSFYSKLGSLQLHAHRWMVQRRLLSR